MQTPKKDHRKRYEAKGNTVDHILPQVNTFKHEALYNQIGKRKRKKDNKQVEKQDDHRVDMASMVQNILNNLIIKRRKISHR